ncbi:MAG: nucleotidyltransferase domain-containing protein, partial [Clostridium sp.]
KVKEQIIDKYNPLKIILFGSCASGCANSKSDIDLCIIMEYQDKQEVLMDILINVESERDVDFILYKPEEWEKYNSDEGSFAGLINRKGILIYG